jgi:SnoaL-like polyketide cyclase
VAIAAFACGATSGQRLHHFEIDQGRDCMDELETARRSDGWRIDQGNLRRDEIDNLRIVRILLDEVWGTGAFHLLPGIVAPTYVGHIPLGDHYGPGGVRIEIQTYRAVLPDLIMTTNELLARGNKVVRRFTVTGSFTPTTMHAARSIVLEGIGIDCLADGMLIESWIKIDPLPH